MKTIDLASLLDEGHWSSYQKLLIFGTALTITLDGVDNQLLPNVVPTLMREWDLPRAAFANALAAGPFGMLIGALLGGIVGDRLGRRTALIGSAAIFGLRHARTRVRRRRIVAACASAARGHRARRRDTERRGARLGVRAATQPAVRNHSDDRLHSARRIHRRPDGSTIIAPYGWRTLFIVGGIVPLVVAAVLFKVLPESPRFLAMNRARWPMLRKVLRRLGHDVPDDVEFVDSAGAPQGE